MQAKYSKKTFKKRENILQALKNLGFSEKRIENDLEMIFTQGKTLEARFDKELQVYWRIFEPEGNDPFRPGKLVIKTRIE